MSEKYPWLCPTTGYYKSGCESSASNTVSQTESDNAEAITTDAYGTYGLQLVYYRVHNNIERDPLFGEDQLEVIERAFNFIGYTESIPSNVRTYQVQGIFGEDLVKLTVGRLAFKYWSTYGGEDRNTPEVYEDIQPMIGDIIYFPQNDVFYEVRDVKYFNEAFGLQSHTYMITCKVYTDSKKTIDFHNPTLSNREDPIYKVAPDDFPNQYEIHDPLALNDELETQALKESENIHMMDVLYTKESGKKQFDNFNGW